jgi:hypothetical protein
MTWRQDAAEGWRIARPTLETVFTTRRRRVLFTSTSALGIVVSAAVHLLVAGDLGEPSSVLAALASGTGAAGILAFVLGLKWRPLAPPVGRFTGGRVMVGDRSEREIVNAWRDGREPTLPVAERLAVAARAKRYRESAPRAIVTNFAAIGFPVPYILAALAVLPNIVGFVGIVGAVNGVVTPIMILTALGRTTAAIETAPDVPDHLEADGRKKRTPRKVLGTDHPDDYS